MKGQEKVTFNELKNFKNQFDELIENFDIKNYPELEKLISNIQDEIELLFMVSEERNEIRISNRTILNKKIKEENKIGAKNAVPNQISANLLEFLSKLEKIGIKIDEKGGFHAGKLKKGTYIKDFIQITFQPKELIKSDHYGQIRKELGLKVQDYISKLKETLEDTKSKSENLFQNYDNINQLLLRLGIQAQIRNYDLFSKGTGIPRAKGEKNISDDNKIAPSFKKIGYLFKYFQENKITLQSRNILKYPDRSLCIYIQSKNVTILISDEIGSNKCFRDATYIVKGPILEDKPITKEMIGEYEGKRIMFSDNRGNRIEEILDQNPNDREQIKTQNGISEDDLAEKELITDRQEFINIIKEKFTIESLDGVSYTKFINKYNTDIQNKYILRSTLASNYAILGLPRNSSVESIKNAIRGIVSKSEINNKGNFLGNLTIQEQLNKLRQYSDFDPQKSLGNTSYGYWLLNLLKIASDNQNSDYIKTLSTQEKKEKLLAITGIDLPLGGQTLSMRLGGISCSTKEYQILLRKRFCLYIDGKENSKDYVNICLEIQELEKEFSEKSGLHTKSIKKPEDFIESIKDDIVTSFDIPKPIKTYKKKESLEKKLTIADLQRFKVYKGKVKSINFNKIHVDVGGLIGKLISPDSNIFIGDEINVIFLETKETIKNGQKYPIFRIHKYEGNEKVLKFCEGKNYDSDSLLVGSNYTGIINNITENKVRVSLSKHCSGFVYINDIPNIDDLKVGKTFKVKFIKMNGELPMFKFVKNPINL